MNSKDTKGENKLSWCNLIVAIYHKTNKQKTINKYLSEPDLSV